MKPITPQKRADIIADLHAGHSMTSTGRRNGVGTSSVSRIARSEGLSTAGTVQTANACKASVANSRAAAAQLVADLLADAALLRQRIYQPVEYRQVSAGKLLTWEQSTPTFADVQKIMTSCAIAIDKHAVLEKLEHDPEDLSDFGRFLTFITGQPEPTDNSNIPEPQGAES